MATNFYTAAELNNLTNAVLDFYMKGDPIKQAIQDRPLLQKLMAGKKTFPGGKELIRGNVKGDYTTTFMGYQYDDTVTYANPANIKQFQWGWKELHAGISMTFTEMKAMGITVVDSLTGEQTSQKSGASVQEISNGLKDKLDDMMEGSLRSMNLMALRDGTQSAKEFAGLKAIVRDNPTTGVVGGIDAAANTWWRNRARTAASGGVITPSTSLQTLTKTLRQEIRALRRYGGKPTIAVAGSSFIEAMEAEVFEKGYYTQDGFAKDLDVSSPGISIQGVGKIVYDPTLDDEGNAKRLYLLDPRHVFLNVMDGEDMKTHAPARPAEKYVLYRATTWTGTMMANKLNCHGVYDIA